MTIISDTCHSNIVVVMPVSLNMMDVTMENRHTNHIMVVVLDKIIGGKSVSKAAGAGVKQVGRPDHACCLRAMVNIYIEYCVSDVPPLLNRFTRRRCRHDMEVARSGLRQ